MAGFSDQPAASDDWILGPMLGGNSACIDRHDEGLGPLYSIEQRFEPDHVWRKSAVETHHQGPPAIGRERLQRHFDLLEFVEAEAQRLLDEYCAAGPHCCFRHRQVQVRRHRYDYGIEALRAEHLVQAGVTPDARRQLHQPQSLLVAIAYGRETHAFELPEHARMVRAESQADNRNGKLAVRAHYSTTTAGSASRAAVHSFTA